MKSLKLLFALLLSANIFASTYLESSYNSIDFAYATSFGDVDASASSGSITFKPQGVNFLLGFTHTSTDFDEVAGLDATGLTSVGEEFLLGYVYESSDSLHIIPFIEVGSQTLEFQGLEESLDTKSFGISWRGTAGDNSTVEFTISHTKAEFDDPAEAENNDDNTSASLVFEYHFEENIALEYGIQTDFDITALHIGVGWNY